MKKWIVGLLVWNTLLTVIIGYGAYELKNGYNLLMHNLEGLVKISQDLHEKQVKFDATTRKVQRLIDSNKMKELLKLMSDDCFIKINHPLNKQIQE